MTRAFPSPASNAPRSGGVSTLDFELPSVQAKSLRRWISAVMGIVIFLAGGVCGAAGMQLAASYRRPVRPADIAAGVAGMLQRELSLTGDQRAQIEEIVRVHHPRLNQIREDILPAMRTELQATFAEMAAVLTPEQAKRWEGSTVGRLDVFYPAPKTTEPAIKPTEEQED